MEYKNQISDAATAFGYGMNPAGVWNMVREALRKVVPAEAFANTDAKSTALKRVLEPLFSMKIKIR